jgi:copper oxidase (laccase) domain-containing protein
MLKKTTDNEIGRVRIVAYGMPTNYRFFSFTHAGHFSALAEAAHGAGIIELAVPRVSLFNAAVAHFEEFPVSHTFDHIKVRTGIDTDAVMLESGQSALIVTGDCPTLALSNIKTGEAVAAHAGRDSLLDRILIDTGTPSRPEESVVGMIMKYTGWNGSDLRGFIAAGIAPEHFSHSFNDRVHGERNKKMIEWIVDRYGNICIQGEISEGKIDMKALIRAQCGLFDISSDAIEDDGIDTFTDPRFWSHRNKGKNAGRNAVLVINARE